jgi:micrococcal nuclease
LAVAVAVTAVAALAGCGDGLDGDGTRAAGSASSRSGSPPIPSSPGVSTGPEQTRPKTVAGPYPVVRVSDGDTFTVDEAGKRVTIRVIGIDTPETHDPRKPVQCYGPEASANAHRLLDGKTVYLEPDPTQDQTDKYGRTLAYVWIGSSLFELSQLRGGFAHEYTYDRPYKRQASFRAAEHAARRMGAGLWAANTCNGDTSTPRPTPS